MPWGWNREWDIEGRIWASPLVCVALLIVGMFIVQVTIWVETGRWPRLVPLHLVRWVLLSIILVVMGFIFLMTQGSY
jgi:hypothetical protein